MEEVIEFLEKSKLQYLATIGLDGKPKVRPFQMMFEDGGKIWYCTGNNKAVYQELLQRPDVEFCASGDRGMTWLRISAKVVFDDNLAIKEKILEHSPLVKSIYKKKDNPLLEVFYLDKVSAAISRIGEAPKVFTF